MASPSTRLCFEVWAHVCLLQLRWHPFFQVVLQISFVLSGLCSFSSWGIRVFQSTWKTRKSYQFNWSSGDSVGPMLQLPPWSPNVLLSGARTLQGGREEWAPASSLQTLAPCSCFSVLLKCSTVRCIHFELKKKKKDQLWIWTNMFLFRV